MGINWNKIKSFLMVLFIITFFAGCSKDSTTGPDDSNNKINAKYAGYLEFDYASIMTDTDTTGYSYGFEVNLKLDSNGTCSYQEALVTGDIYDFDGKWKYENNSIIVTDDSNRTYNMKITAFEEDLYKLPKYTLKYTVNRKWSGKPAVVNYTLNERLWSHFDSKLTGNWKLIGMDVQYPDSTKRVVDLNSLSFYSYTFNIGTSGGFRMDSIVLGSTVIFTGDCDVWKGRLVFHNDLDTKIGPYTVNDSLLVYKNKSVEDSKDVTISYTFKKK